VLVRIRVKLENEVRGLLRTFGVVFGKKAGGFARRADEIVAGELDASPSMRIVVEALLHARAAILERIKVLDRQVLTAAKRNPTARLFMTAPGVGAITALSVASAFDDAARFRHSSSAGAYLGLTPRRYESGEVSRNGHISKHGNSMTRKHLYEAATTLLTRTTAFLLHPESLGPPAGADLRVQEGPRRGRAQARRHSPCDVEDQHRVPLEQGGSMTTTMIS
jgi:transposase